MFLKYRLTSFPRDHPPQWYADYRVRLASLLFEKVKGVGGRTLFERGACLMILWPRGWALNRGRALIRACALIRGNGICIMWEKWAEELFSATSLMIPSLKGDKVQTCSKEFSLASLPFRRISSKIAFFTSWKNERKTPFSGKICSFVSCSRHSESS